MAPYKPPVPSTETAKLILNLEKVFNKYEDKMTPSAVKQIVYQIIHDPVLEQKLYEDLKDEEYPRIVVFRDVLNTMTEACASNIRTDIALALDKMDLSDIAGMSFLQLLLNLQRHQLVNYIKSLCVIIFFIVFKTNFRGGAKDSRSTGSTHCGG